MRLIVGGSLAPKYAIKLRRTDIANRYEYCEYCAALILGLTEAWERAALTDVSEF